jgi:formylglycine-generating enzyme required for sulfatase activity
MLLVDQSIGEGFSGGPVLQGGKVVGIVSETDEQTTYAVSAIVAREALVGWGVKLGGQIDTSVTSTTIQAGPEPPVVNPCSRETLREYGIDFVRICSGTFTMGSADNDPLAHVTEKPAHQVTLSEFWIGKTEVTNAQYRRFQPKHQGKDDLPAVGVSWTAAKAACEYFGGRLPTEAEWEYAARAGRQTAWSFGDDEKMLFDYAWYDKNSDDTPHPVALKTPNDWGLYDMHGNAWEWVADRYAPYDKEPQTDPAGPQTGRTDVQPYVLRGGAFIFSPRVLRSAFRGTDGPGFRGRAIGFRCVRGRR